MGHYGADRSRDGVEWNGRLYNSIFQSKDDPEIRFGFQYKVILKNDEEAAKRPISSLGFLF